MGVSITERGLMLDGRTVPLLSGSIHYWRLSRTVWRDCLAKMRELGLEGACTYVPWSVHEIEEGRFDFGEIVPEKDLVAFIRMVHEEGLWLIVRPGPHINAELSGFGYPQRILDNPRVQAQGPDGSPIVLPAPPQGFTVPSYASERFRQELSTWMDAVAERIAPWLYPHGPIVMVQCDNEHSLFFRTGTYEQDYSDGALAAYRHFLRDKYGDATKLAAAYGSAEPSFAVRPPTDFSARRKEELPYYLDWAEFKERLMGDALAGLRQEWEARGIREVAFSHNLPFSRARTPFNIPCDERTLDTVGMDFYPRREDFPRLRRQLLGYEGQTRFPWSPEFSAGCYQIGPPIDLDDLQFTTPAALMHGLRGFNFYMAVERERWFGSPITRRGGYRPRVREFYQRFLALVKRERLTELRRRARVLLVTPRIYDRLEKAASIFGHFSSMVREYVADPEAVCDESTFGYVHCPQIAHDRIRRAWIETLERRGVSYRVGDSETGPAPWRDYAAVACPTFSFADRALQQSLVDALQRGATVVIGPEVPSEDESFVDFSLLDGYLGRPVHKLAGPIETFVCNAEGGRLILISDALVPGEERTRQSLDAVLEFLRVDPEWAVEAPLAREIHEGGGRLVIYLANPTGEQRLASMNVPSPHRLRDLDTGEVFFAEGAATIAMAPWTVRMMEATPC